MSRAERRARQRAARRRKSRPIIAGPVFIGSPEVIAQLDPHCPDCASEIEFWTDDAGMRRVDVLHDATCPIWRALQRQANR